MFSKYTEMDEIYEKLLKVYIPSKRDGNIYVLYLSKIDFEVRISMEQSIKSKI
jgi:hypothetical protein